MSLADTVLACGSAFSSFEIGPRDLLQAVIKSLSNARDGQSHLLPKLLQHSEFVLGYSDPAAHIDARWPTYNDLVGLEEEHLTDCPSQIIDETTLDGGWTLGDDFGVDLDFM